MNTRITDIDLLQIRLDTATLLRSPRSRGFYAKYTKRVVDSLLVLITAPITVPLIVVMALWIMRDGHAPFYSQLRVGRSGRLFRIWKLRTMVPGAEKLLARQLAESPKCRDEWNATQKLKNDPRITRTGRLLRKTSLDELPQLWNVLNGTMSLVGPRPMLPEQQTSYHGLSYYELRPGITGLWQISDRNESEFTARVKFDDEYSHSVSPTTDAGILMKTISVVLRCTGY